MTQLHHNGEVMKVCPNPVFVIGSPRSGTTILGMSLSTHPSFWASDETQIFTDLFGDGRLHLNYKRENDLAGSWLMKQGIPREQFFEMAGVGFNAMITRCAGGKRWVDHTPVHSEICRDLAMMFPGAKFLHILRDGREVVNSMIHMLSSFSKDECARLAEQFSACQWMSDFRAACQTWRKYVEACTSLAKLHPQRCRLVRYEQLVANPEQAFADILRFLGEEDDPAPAAYQRGHRLNSSFASAPKPPSQVWEKWNDEQRGVFITEAAATMLTHCVLSDEEEQMFKSLMTLRLSRNFAPPPPPVIIQQPQQPSAEMSNLQRDMTELRAALSEMQMRFREAEDEIREQARVAENEKLRRIVRKHVPARAGVTIVSNGDDDLLSIAKGARGRHFMEDAGGVYAGFHAADDADAIARLESHRETGAAYLVVPATSFWWLDHYTGWKQHLDTNCRLVVRDGHCAIYHLIATKKSARSAHGNNGQLKPAKRIAATPAQASRSPSKKKSHRRAGGR